MPMLPGLFGLWVDTGYYSSEARLWLREPAAEFTCRHGCSRGAYGAAAVAQFTRAIGAWHITHCPALRKGSGS